MAGRICHRGKESGKTEFFAGRGVGIEIAVHVLSQKRDLAEAAGAEVGKLVEYALRLARALAAAGIRHDAVGAEIVASAHDADESRHSVRAYSHGNHVAVSLGGAEFYADGGMSGLHRLEKRREVEIGIGAGHEVNAVVGHKVFPDPLGHASYHADYQAGKVTGTFAAQRVEKRKPREDFLLGIVADRAGVEQHGVGIFGAFGHFVTGHAHD